MVVLVLVYFHLLVLSPLAPVSPFLRGQGSARGRFRRQRSSRGLGVRGPTRDVCSRDLAVFCVNAGKNEEPYENVV